MLDDIGTGIAVTSQGSAYVSGSFTTSLALGAAVMNSAGSADAFLARFGRDGSLQWLGRAGGGGDSAV